MNIQIINHLGQTIYNTKEYKQAGKHTLQLDVSSLNSGMYLCSITINNKILLKKLIIE